MYRFLIIDDEPLVREGISTTIDWNAHGFELVGVCRDGREGLQALEELRPDVVLTDICMPFVDGLELAASIAEEHPGTRTILLTGYDEFEYAQEAVKLNVRDFLLKPITATELREILDSLRGELDEERARRRDLERLREQVRESLPVFRERFLNHLVRDALAPKEALRKARLLDLDLEAPWYVVVVCDRDRHDSEGDLSGVAVQNEIDAVTSVVSGAVSFSTTDDQGILIITGDAVDQSITRALECAEAISEQVKRSLNRTVSIGIGDSVDALDELPRSLRTARIALEQRFVLGPDQIVTMDQVRGTSAEISRLDDSAARGRLIHALKTGAATEATTAFREVLRGFQGRDAAEHCLATMHRVLADVFNALDAIDLNYRELPGYSANPFEQLTRMKTIDEIDAWFRRLFEEIRRQMESRRNHHSRHKALAAEEYILANYTQPALSLQSVCRALAVSKSYLSPIFKAHTGMTFVEFLTETRLRRARELLTRTDLKVYEIAEHAGYRDAHYFSLTFRKQTGLTPSEYRESTWGDTAS